MALYISLLTYLSLFSLFFLFAEIRVVKDFGVARLIYVQKKLSASKAELQEAIKNRDVVVAGVPPKCKNKLG